MPGSGGVGKPSLQIPSKWSVYCDLGQGRGVVDFPISSREFIVNRQVSLLFTITCFTAGRAR
jgi:hypothetical protein